MNNYTTTTDPLKGCGVCLIQINEEGEISNWKCYPNAQIDLSKPNTKLSLWQKIKNWLRVKKDDRCLGVKRFNSSGKFEIILDLSDADPELFELLTGAK